MLYFRGKVGNTLKFCRHCRIGVANVARKYFEIYTLHYTQVRHIYAIRYRRIQEYTLKSCRHCRIGVANVTRKYFKIYTLYYTQVRHIYAMMYRKIQEYTLKSCRHCRIGVANVTRKHFKIYTLHYTQVRHIYRGGSEKFMQVRKIVFEKKISEGVFMLPRAISILGGGRTSSPLLYNCLLYTSPSPRDKRQSRMPSSA